MKPRKVVAIVLAAGFSSRMGQLKALLPWKGKTLLEYKVEQFEEAGMDEIIVVVGYQAEKLVEILSSYDVNTVFNPDFAQGKTTSIRKGVERLPEDCGGILISAVDQPVASETLKVMTDALRSSNAPVVIPVYRGKRGHPVVFSGRLRQDLLEVDEATKGLRNVIRNYEKEIREVSVSDETVLWNFNRREDYETSLRGG